jgi:predicted metal-dependent hydrolase
MRNKWASYSTSGRLTFDEGLTGMSNHLQDYVIVHELLHFQVPNHGKLWKSLMHAHLGDYEPMETELKRIAQDKPPRRQ